MPQQHSQRLFAAPYPPKNSSPQARLMQATRHAILAGKLPPGAPVGAPDPARPSADRGRRPGGPGGDGQGRFFSAGTEAKHQPNRPNISFRRSAMWNFRVILSMLALLLPASPLAGQETRSMIFGRVVDPQSSAVAGAKVVVSNTDTNVAFTLTTNETGYYEANLLIPGNYQVTAEAPGFKKWVRARIELPVSTRLQINVQLELGAITETVSVTEEAPLLETNAVSSGRIIDSRSLSELPVARNNPVLLAAFSPGIYPRGLYRTPAHRAASAVVAMLYTPGNVGGRGALDTSNDLLIDGVPNLGNNRRIAFMPHTDALQEFKVETSNFDASVGHAVGASISMMTRAGTNAFHGGLTEQHMQQRWNATPFFIKQAYYRNIAAAEAKGDKALANYLRSQDPQRSGRTNDYAATLGGPVLLPKIYSGKDKLFFFVNFSGTNERLVESTSNINVTVPTLANRQGDFSQLLNADAVRYQIYDPLSVRRDPARPGHYIRDAFPGNLIPRSRWINPVYDSYAKMLPTPNNDPSDPRREPLENYIATAMPWNFDYYSVSNRFDYHHSNAHRFFARWSWSRFLEDRSDWTYETARGIHSSDLERAHIAGTADWVWTASPSTFFDFAVTTNRYREGVLGAAVKKFKPSDVGLPAYLDAKAAGQTHLPRMILSGYRAMSVNFTTLTRTRTTSGKADVSHIRGPHTLRAGFDTRQYFRTGGGGGNTSGSFTFDNLFTRRNDDLFTPAGSLGHSWAAFLMGLPSTLLVDTNDSYATHTPAYGWYAQDNWRINAKLTVNLGLRLEYEQGMTERYNRMLSYFDRNARLPISGAAEAAYARAPLAELPASQFAVRGGSLYAGSGGAGRRIWQNELMWMPRLSAAYQLGSKAVLRFGYGIFYDSLNALYLAPNQLGFSRSTSTNVTNDFGANWLVGDPRNGVSPLRDPFPVRADGTRFDAPVRDALGLMAVAGRSFSFQDYSIRHARQQRWRAGVQRQLGPRTVFEAAYSGAYSDRVYVSRSLNPLPENYWAGGLQRNDAIAGELNRNVANPFLLSNFADLRTSAPLVYQDMSTQGFFTSGTIRKHQLLRPFPHMADLTDSAASLGEARSDALELNLERRFAKGFNLNIAYARLRAREADIFLNEFDAAPGWRPTDAGPPHRFIASSIVELPFGAGKPFFSQGLLKHILGGFQLGVTYEFQIGPPIDFPNLFYYGKLEDIHKPRGTRTLDEWFNTANFERISSKAPAAFHRRVFPTRVDDVRADMMNEWNLNVQREFRFSESLRLQLRFDAINALNRTVFGPPNSDPLSSNFGRITTQTEAPNRYVQLQGRLRF
jgi:hypothetical protein